MIKVTTNYLNANSLYLPDCEKRCLKVHTTKKSNILTQKNVIFKAIKKPVIVLYNCYPSTWKVEAGGL
jgi:hypothetical protein